MSIGLPGRVCAWAVSSIPYLSLTSLMVCIPTSSIKPMIGVCRPIGLPSIETSHAGLEVMSSSPVVGCAGGGGGVGLSAAVAFRTSATCAGIGFAIGVATWGANAASAGAIVTTSIGATLMPASIPIAIGIDALVFASCEPSVVAIDITAIATPTAPAITAIRRLRRATRAGGTGMARVPSAMLKLACAGAGEASGATGIVGTFTWPVATGGPAANAAI